MFERVVVFHCTQELSFDCCTLPSWDLNLELLPLAKSLTSLCLDVCHRCEWSPCLQFLAVLTNLQQLTLRGFFQCHVCDDAGEPGS